MSDTLNEQLSAFLDGELPPEETDLLLKRLVRDAQLRATLARYGLVGDTLRGVRAQAGADFALRVRAAREREPALPQSPVAAVVAASAPRRPAPRWLRPAAGAAIAATVAGLAVLVLGREPSLPAAGGVPVAAVADGLPAPVAMLAPPGSGQVVPAPGARGEPGAPPSSGEPASYVTPPAGRVAVVAIPPAQLANYVVAHSEYSAPLGRRNVLTGLIADDAFSAAPAVDPAGAADDVALAPVATGAP